MHIIVPVWHNPHGQLVSRNLTVEVNPVVGSAGGRAAILTFHKNQSQGGKYKCRIAVPGNNFEKLPACVGGAIPS